MTSEILVDRNLQFSGAVGVTRNVRIALPSGTSETQPTHVTSALAMSPPVNAHDHGYGIRTTDFGGVDDALEVWSAGLPMRPDVDPYLKAAVAFGRLACGGVGATMHCHNASSSGDMVHEAAEVVRAAKDVGLRSAFSCPLMDENPWLYDGPAALKPFVGPAEWEELSDLLPQYKLPEEQIAAVETIAANHHGSGVDIQYGPIGPQWCSEKLLGMIADASRHKGRRIHMHLLESPRQRAWLDQTYPEGIITYLDTLGFLSPRLTVAHGVQLRPDECELLADRGVMVVINPSANLRLRSGIAPLAEFRKAGLRYAIGLDGTGFDDDQDLWREMRLLYLLNGGVGMRRETSAQELFEAVTRTGREVINCPGDEDLVLIDYEELIQDAMFDDLDELAVLLTRMTGQYVNGLIVAGKWVVRDRKLLGIDLEHCLNELRQQARAVAELTALKREKLQRLQAAIRQYYAFGSQG